MRPGERLPTPLELSQHTYRAGEVRALDKTPGKPLGVVLQPMRLPDVIEPLSDDDLA